MISEEYSDKYFAYIDILGFSNIISEIDKNKDRYEEVIDVLSDIRKFSRSQSRSAGGLSTQTFSDSIIMATNPSWDGARAILDICAELYNRLLLKKIFCRGAIVKGKIYFSNEIVFGSALVSAYNMAERIAIFPRILVSRDVLSDLSKFGKGNQDIRKYYSARYLRSEDGPTMLHPFLKYQERVKKAGELLETYPIRFKKDVKIQQIIYIREAIRLNLFRSSDNPSIYQKYNWLARYFNVSIAAHAPKGKKSIVKSIPVPSWYPI